MNEPALRDQFSVKTICQLTGINNHTLRAWERRYGLVMPRRLENGRRVYGLEDLEKLKVALLLLRKGFLIGHIARHSLPELHKLLSDAAQTPTMNDASQIAQRRSDELAVKLEQALDHYDLARLSPLLAQAQIDCGIRAYIFELLLPLLQRVGRGVACEELSIGQEHALSAVVRYHLMQNLFTLSDRHALIHHGEAPKSFAVATMEGNQHELGTLMGAVLCAYHGYRVFYLGMNMPAVGLSQAVRALGANCVLLGLSPIESDANISAYLGEVVAMLPSFCEVWIGGKDEFKVPRTFESVRGIGDLVELDALLGKLRRYD